jgi:prolyl oligopeptidase
MLKSLSFVAAAAVFSSCGKVPNTSKRVAPLNLAAEESQKPEDPYLWLEEVEGQKAVQWCDAQNALAVHNLQSSKSFEEIRAVYEQAFSREDKIVNPYIHKGMVYNFWTDKNHPHGIWRRTPLTEFRKSPEPNWEVLLDIDNLREKEKTSWVYRRAQFCKESNHVLITLSPGGSDKNVVREFDIQSKAFVKGGFELPASKGWATWLQKDQILITRDFGEGSLTESGYPRENRILKRGQKLEDATLLHRMPKAHMLSDPKLIKVDGKQYAYIEDWVDFYHFQYHLYEIGKKKPQTIPVPDHASLQGFHKGWALFKLGRDWISGETLLRQDSLIAMDLRNLKQSPELLFSPATADRYAIHANESQVLVHATTGRSANIYALEQTGSEWESKTLKAPTGTLEFMDNHSPEDGYWVLQEDYLVPPTLHHLDPKTGNWSKQQSTPERFDSSKYQVKYVWYTSKDGTKVPYSLIHKKNLKRNGKNPTILYGYGGFRISLEPYYLDGMAQSWLDAGGVYAIAHIRGGGEFGTRWHEASLKHNRMRCYEDFTAAAEHLIASKITSPDHLGISGGSNGGLLVGACMVLRPDLFRAVLCTVPLLDMQRYHLLHAGSSWIAEYGDPDVRADWEVIKTYSPYHNLKEGVIYPEVFFYTSMLDDRVHPGHARKMAAKMQDMGIPNVHFYESKEGGHSAGTNYKQKAKLKAMRLGFLLDALK